MNEDGSILRTSVELSREQLTRAASRQRKPMRMAIVEPALELVEEVVLLSLDAPSRSVRRAVRVAASAHPEGPADRRHAMNSLIERGFVTHSHRLGRAAATPAARLPDRTNAVRAIIRRIAAPRGRDAELLVLLALARSLPIEGGEDRRHAILRICSIGTGGASIPPVVAAGAASLNAATMRDLAAKLLPPMVGKDGWVQINTPSGVGM